MTMTKLGDVADQVQKFWSPMFMKQMRETNVLINLVDKSYEGEIKKKGDTVRITQINKPTGELQVLGTDSDTFESEALSKSYVDLVINRRAVAAYEFEDVTDILSLVDKENPEVMAALNAAVSEQINDHLQSLIVPSTSAPDHSIASVTDFNKTQLLAVRNLAAVAKWPKDKGWYGLLDPVYYGDVLADATLGSSDYGADDTPVIGGHVARNRYGFNLIEDNSMSTDVGYFFEPNFMHLAMPYSAQIKISDLHSNKQFGYLMSVHVLFGAKLGNDGASRCIKVYNT